MTIVTIEEHPFAQFVRILGKGKRGARSLTREEAAQAMGMLLDGQTEESQLGAFLMLLRHKEESAEELAGFADAVRFRLHAPALQVDLDWPSYAGKKRHLPWYLLAAKALAGSGIRILMHGGGLHTAGRLYTEQLLEMLEIPLCSDWSGVADALEQQNLAFIPLGCWMPELQRMINLRNILGLRSPIHSLARILNPLQAQCGLQSIFHPGYQAVHRDASQLLGDNVIVIKGEGGEIEINPDSACQLLGNSAQGIWTEDWPAMSAQRHVKPERLEPENLLSVWLGQTTDDYALQAITGTMALALRGLGQSREQALEQARFLWEKRLNGVS
jgi:anthranilate phosphoribosyltransferase